MRDRYSQTEMRREGQRERQRAHVNEWQIDRKTNMQKKTARCLTNEFHLRKKELSHFSLSH